MEYIKEIVMTLPKTNKQEVFNNFHSNLRLNWSEMEEIMEFIRKTKQVQLSYIQKMPFSSQVRLACYLYYDVVNPVTYEKLN